MARLSNGRMGFVPDTLPNFHFINDYSVALDSPITWTGERQTITVPRGYVSDFATVPKFLWWLFGPTGKYTAAAILHDYLCTLLVMRPVMKSTPSAREVDGIFRRRCKELGVDYVSRWLLWTGVRWGALANHFRRRDWHRDAPLVAVWSLIALAPVLIATVGIVAAYLVLGIVRLFARLIRLR